MQTVEEGVIGRGEGETVAQYIGKCPAEMRQAAPLLRIGTRARRKATGNTDDR